MYHSEKHFGNKSGQFKTVFGYIPNTKTKYVQTVGNKEKYYIDTNVCSLPLMFMMLYLERGATKWKIIRIC